MKNVSPFSRAVADLGKGKRTMKSPSPPGRRGALINRRHVLEYALIGVPTAFLHESGAAAAPVCTQPVSPCDVSSEQASCSPQPPVQAAALIAAHFLNETPPSTPGPSYVWDLRLEALLAIGDRMRSDAYLHIVQRLALARGDFPGRVRTFKQDIFSCLSFDLWRRTRDARYLPPFVNESRTYRSQVLRAGDGAISFYIDDAWATRHAQLGIALNKEWRPILIDQLQEYASRMARTGHISGETDFFREAIDQWIIFADALADQTTGLWSHGRGWFTGPDTVSTSKWGRGQGWAIRGLVETLTYLPRGTAGREKLERMLMRLAEGLLIFQNDLGFWCQIVDRPDCYSETSGTGIIAYYLARAVKQDLLPARPYRKSALRAYQALACSRITRDGHVCGGSIGLPPLATDQDYLNHPARIDDPHGQFGALMAIGGRLLLT